MINNAQILYWNYRGAKSGEFLRELKEIKRCYRPVINILLKPKSAKWELDEICRKIGNMHWICSEADGFSSDMWMLWDEEERQIYLRYAHKSFLHIAITSNGGRKWKLSAIYANPNLSIRRHFMEQVERDEGDGTMAPYKRL